MPTDTIGYYHMLNVAKDASIEEIKTAFRKLAHRFHPDKNPGDKEAEEKFKDISRTYEVLTDPQARSLYDRTGIDDFNKFGRGDFAGNPFGGFGGFQGREMGCGFKRGCGFRRFQNSMSDNFFRNEPIIYNISISPEDANKGIEISVETDGIHPGKIFNIKLPGGIENGSLLRCVDEADQNEFFIRVNYSRKQTESSF